jgi:pimeloyl-ACP methyl ester carboxylesterase
MTHDLVLLPGLDGTELFFGPLLGALPNWIRPRIITYPIDGPNDYESLLQVVERGVESLDGFSLLGWSFGGPLALMLAHRRPHQVQKLILCGTFVKSPKPILARFRMLLRSPVVATVRAVRRTRLLLPGQSNDALRKAKAASWGRVGAGTLARRARAALSVDVRPQLMDFRGELMYLLSSRDEVIGRHCLEEVLRIAPRTRVAEMNGSHMALFHDPKSAADPISAFMAGSVLH